MWSYGVEESVKPASFLKEVMCPFLGHEALLLGAGVSATIRYSPMLNIWSVEKLSTALTIGLQQLCWV